MRSLRWEKGDKILYLDSAYGMVQSVLRYLVKVGAPADHSTAIAMRCRAALIDHSTALAMRCSAARVDHSTAIVRRCSGEVASSRAPPSRGSHGVF